MVANNGRDRLGRFALGNTGGPGNPHADKVSRLRAALLNAITPADVREVARAMITEAKDGNVHAAKELLDRVLGKSIQPSVSIDSDYLKDFYVELFGEIPPEAFLTAMRQQREDFDAEDPCTEGQ